MKVAKKIGGFGALAVCLSIGAGCATITQEEYNVLRSDVDKALSMAESMSASQSSMERAISAATLAAQQARNEAGAAKQAAEDALACCNKNTLKMERMFDGMMKK